MTEIKIKDWNKHYVSPTKKLMYSVIWWAKKKGELNFARKEGNIWLINQEAFEEYYKDHGYMEIERVKEPEEATDPYKEKLKALLLDGIEKLNAQHLAYKAVVEGQGRRISDLEDNMSLRNKINVSLLAAMVLLHLAYFAVIFSKFIWG